MPGETQKVISKQRNNSGAHYYSLKLACKLQEKAVHVKPRPPQTCQELMMNLRIEVLRKQTMLD